MRKTLLFFSILFLSSSCLFIIAQSKSKNFGSKTVVFNQNVNLPLNSFEKEILKNVYRESLKENVLDKPERLKSIKNIIRNRVEVITMSNYPKDYQLLSQVPLFDKYNTTLKREKFSLSKFNPFKYNFDFYAKQTQVVRVDNTDYYIVIKSQHQK